MPEQTLIEQSLINKLHRLPPERLDEVADFVDFISQRHAQENDLSLTRSAATTSIESFRKVGDNPEDAVYDN